MADSDLKPTESNTPPELHQHHVSNILDEVLDETPQEEERRHHGHPMILDLILAVGLLFVLGGFTAGLFGMYLTHAAEESIARGNFQAAIVVLEGVPLPDLFAPPSSRPRELLDQALYMDAMQKFNVNTEDPTALTELERIEPGSSFFEVAQTILKEQFKPSAVTLQTGTVLEEHISAKEAQARAARQESQTPPPDTQ